MSLFSISSAIRSRAVPALLAIVTVACISPAQAQREPAIRPIEHQIAFGVAFSPDGRQFAATQAGRVVLYDAANGAVLRRIIPRFEKLARVEAPYALLSLDFSPVGSLLAGGRADGAICLWKMGSDGEPAILKTQSRGDYVRCVRFSPDGTLLASGGSDDNVTLWDVIERKVKATLPGYARCIAFSPNGRLLASGSLGECLSLWDVGAGTLVRAMKARGMGDSFVDPNAVPTKEDMRAANRFQAGDVTCVGFSPDGKTLLSGCSHGDIHIFDAGTGKEKGILTGHTFEVVGVHVLSNNQNAISASQDGTIRVWDLNERHLISLAKWGWGSVVSVALSADRKSLLCSGQDGLLRLLLVDQIIKGGQPDDSTLKGHPFYHDGPGVQDVAFSGDGGSLISFTGPCSDQVRVWDCTTGSELQFYRHGHGATESVVMSPPSFVKLTGGGIRMRDVVDGEVSCFALDGMAKALAPFAPKEVGEPTPQVSMVSGDCVLLCAVDCRSRSDTMFVWSLLTGKLRFKVSSAGTDSVITIGKLSDSGRFLVTANEYFDRRKDGNTTFVSVWNLMTSQQILRLQSKLNIRSVRSVAISPDDSTVAIGSTTGLFDAGEVTIASLKNGKPASGFPRRVPTGVFCVAFSPDGKKLCCGSAEGRTTVWDTARSQEALSLSGHEGSVNAAVFSPDGSVLATGSEDGTIRLWNSRSGEEVTPRRAFDIGGMKTGQVR